jgi:hypothetical protein
VRVQTFKYTGDDPVDLPALGLVEVTKGTHVEFAPEQVESVEGSPLWQHVTKPKSKES